MATFHDIFGTIHDVVRVVLASRPAALEHSVALAKVAHLQFYAHLNYAVFAEFVDQSLEQLCELLEEQVPMGPGRSTPTLLNQVVDPSKSDTDSLPELEYLSDDSEEGEVIEVEGPRGQKRAGSPLLDEQRPVAPAARVGNQEATLELAMRAMEHHFEQRARQHFLEKAQRRYAEGEGIMKLVWWDVKWASRDAARSAQETRFLHQILYYL